MTKIILAHELLEAGIRKSQIAQNLGVSRRTIIRWSQVLEKHGSLDAYLDYYHVWYKNYIRDFKQKKMVADSNRG